MSFKLPTTKYHTKFIKYAILFLLVGLSVSWTADYLRDIIDSITKSTILESNILKFLLSLIFFSVAGYFIFKNQEVFTKAELVNKPKEPDPHTAMILFVSTVSSTTFEINDEKIAITYGKQKTRFLVGDLDQDLKTFKEIKNEDPDSDIKIATEMLLNSIKIHKRKLKHIYLISSSDDPIKKDRKGSHELIKYYKPLINKYIKGIQIHERTVSFDNLDSIRETIRIALNEFKKAKLENSDIIIDITPGTKQISIAGVLETIEHPRLEFQYVSNDYKVTSFDLLTLAQQDAM